MLVRAIFTTAFVSPAVMATCKGDDDLRGILFTGVAATNTAKEAMTEKSENETIATDNLRVKRTDIRSLGGF